MDMMLQRLKALLTLLPSQLYVARAEADAAISAAAAARCSNTVQIPFRLENRRSRWDPFEVAAQRVVTAIVARLPERRRRLRRGSQPALTKWR